LLTHAPHGESKPCSHFLKWVHLEDGSLRLSAVLKQSALATTACLRRTLTLITSISRNRKSLHAEHSITHVYTIPYYLKAEIRRRMKYKDLTSSEDHIFKETCTVSNIRGPRRSLERDTWRLGDKLNSSKACTDTNIMYVTVL
jgi:hypothetical protein